MSGDSDYSVSIAKAQAAALPFGMIAVAEFLLFASLWGFESIAAASSLLLPWYFLPTFFLGILLHELIHGFTWMSAGRLSFRQIKFGFHWKSLTPYAHCLVPLTVRTYIIGTVMPALVLGFLPFLVALVTGNGWIALFGILFTFAAAGDFLIIWLLRSVRWNQMVKDHSTRVGCVIVDDPILQDLH